jgi:hypothetical protein
MAVEIGVRCRDVPDAAKIADLVGPLMSAALGCGFVAAWADAEKDVWLINWGGSATAHVVPLPKGLHEFGDNWYLNVEPGERGVDLSLLVAVIVAASAAILFDGQVVDELSLAGGGAMSGGALLVKVFGVREQSASEVMAVLGQAGPA